MIPERVVRFTSVTSRGPRRFENLFGNFDYRNIKQDYFFGFASADVGNRKFLVAEPEKALLDHWHLSEGEWTPERLDEMRYQHVQRVVAERLKGYVERFRSPRLDRTVQRWLQLATSNEFPGHEFPGHPKIYGKFLDHARIDEQDFT